ncbi:signal peptidase I [Pelagirhabdus alkalitolerans]|uniref:Signal peptidase I n=1 Tax=Pelagirhabdus alkalitolerans TaxID=1612202 RepID=A0A1G6JKZ6_9BACI|nr:signal peptidase I [Pelagirhabdus alkalitolerans]SDC19357.1 signal peptidase I [Pelagirhabdus alkalitolerans]
MVNEIISWIKAIVISLVIVLVVREFVMTPSIVKGDSMLPNLSDGDRIIISKLHTINRFDEIAFMSPDTNDNYVKRVVGMPGDRVQIIDDILYINGTPYEEAYLDDLEAPLIEEGFFTRDFDLERDQGYQVVPEGFYFVLGDNRPISRDSRDFGIIEKDSVIGEVIFRIWPLEGVGTINPEL